MKEVRASLRLHCGRAINRALLVYFVLRGESSALFIIEGASVGHGGAGANYLSTEIERSR